MSTSRIIVALDFDDARAANALVSELDPQRCKLKVGKELFVRTGPGQVRRLVDAGFDVFLDLKFHDIPNTVAGACRAAADLGVWMVNVHAAGGRAMLEAARQAIPVAPGVPHLIGVTVLTSLNGDGLAETGVVSSPAAQVTRLASLSQACGLDGVVCSARECTDIRSHCGDSFVLVTPGIRPAGTAAGDQNRVVTPAAALVAGSNYLVIGRPITAAPQPMQAISQIDAELDAYEQAG